MAFVINKLQRWCLSMASLALGLVAVFTLVVPMQAQALPAFARQTGQNCVSCHTGGQFPELTPYGRMFKMTGYTIGERTVPLSVMGVASYASVNNVSKSDSADAGISTTNSGSDFYKNGEPILATGSLFIAGKVTDNIGAFTQITYDNYAQANADGSSSGHTQADNMDFRYANRLIDANRDLIYGISLNNNPSVSDPWNTAAAWMQYVPVPSPGSHQFIDGAAPYPGYGSGGNIAGLTAYMYWNKTLYAEVGAYRTADGAFRFMSQGIDDTINVPGSITRLDGLNPYWRLAYTREWGPHNLMIGTSGMLANVYDGLSDPSDPLAYNQVRNTGVDAQYQYILDPHTITAQVHYMRQETNYSPNTLAGASSFVQVDGVTPVDPYNASDTLNVLRAKLAYTYKAKYGGSLSYFNVTGTTNTLNQTAGFVDASGQITMAPNQARITSNLSGNPATNGITYEAFYIPIQNVRIGAQYTAYSTYNGASDNYDGLGRNASDNNTLFLYAWVAF